MHKITQTVSGLLFLFSMWCFIYPYAAEASVCKVISCNVYLVCGAILTIITVVVFVVSFYFTDNKKQNYVNKQN